MKNKLRVLTLLLAVIISASAFTACSDDKPDSGEVSGNTTAETTTPEAAKPDKTESLDIFLAEYKGINYGGEDLDILSSNVINYTLTVRQVPEDMETGDRVNDALYRRDRLLEDSFGTKIVYTLIEPDSSDELQKRISANVNSGDDIYDLAFGNMIANGKNLIINKHILDIASLEDIDLSSPWWHQIANRDLTVNGKMFLATGDITPRYIFSTYLTLFNKKLFEDNDIELPYQAAYDGKWTIDMFYEMIKGTAQDLNNNGKMGDYEDYYGYANEGITYPLLNGFGVSVIDISSGEVSITAENESFYICSRITSSISEYGRMTTPLSS